MPILRQFVKVRLTEPKPRLCRPFIRHFDVKNELAFWNRIALVENLAQDFVTEIQLFTFDPGLTGRDEQAHEFGRARGFVQRFPEFGDRVELTHAGYLIDEGKNNSREDETWAAPDSDIGSTAKLGIVDIGGVLPAMSSIVMKLAVRSGFS